MHTEDHRADGAMVAAVTTAPDSEEESKGHLFSGRFGSLWNSSLRAAGLKRADVSLVPLMSCAPPGNPGGAYGRMMDKLRKENKRRDKAGMLPLPTPIECCKPRVDHDLAGYKHLLLLGKTPLSTLAGISRSVDKVRGSPWGISAEWKKVPHDSPDAVRWALPTFDPGYVFRAPNRKHMWIKDMRKAWRLFTGTLDWEDPIMEMKPSPQRIIEWFNTIQPTRHLNGTIGAKEVCDDVETGRHHQGMRPTQVPLRTIAIARWKDGIEMGTVECIGIPLLSTDGHTRFYTPEEEAWIRAILKWALEREDIAKIGHNAGDFDRKVYEAQLSTTPRPRWDSIFPTRAANPSLPKGLKPNGRTYTDVGEWDSDEKEESIATGTQDDGELLIYNCFDTAVNLRMWVRLRDEAALANYYVPIPNHLLKLDWWNGADNKGWDGVTVPSLFDIDHANQDRCVFFHYSGFWVNPQEVQAQLKVAEHQKAVIYSLLQQRLKFIGSNLSLEDLVAQDENDVDDDDFDEVNPNSTMALRDLYFSQDQWDLPFLPAVGGKDSQGRPMYAKRDFLTKTDALSTSDSVHRAYLSWGATADGTGGGLTLEQRDIMYLVRVYRRLSNKIIGTSLRPMQPEKAVLKKDGSFKKWSKSWLYADGYVHSNFSAHTTNVGRDASGGPNLQNIGRSKGQGGLKKIFQARPGEILYGADINQAHLFIIANEWKIPALVDCIANGYDPHNYNAMTTFGDDFTGAEGFISLYEKPDKGSRAENIRDVIKVFIYASVYGASPETVWRVLTSTEGSPPANWLDKITGRYVYTRKEKEVPDIGALIAATMPYLGMSVDDVRDIHARWLKGQPQWQEAWERAEEEYRVNGYVASYLFGRRSGDLGDDPNKIRNFSVLATERDVMAMIEGRIERAFPRGGGGPGTGLVYQCHDSGGVRWSLPSHLDPMWAPSKEQLQIWGKHRDPSVFPQEIGENLVALTKCFTLEIDGWRFPIGGEADVGRTLKDI